MNEQKKFNSQEHGMYIAKEKINPEDVEVLDPEVEVPAEEVKLPVEGEQRTFMGKEGAYVAKKKIDPEDREVGVDVDEPISDEKKSDEKKSKKKNNKILNAQEVPAVTEDGKSATEVSVNG